MLTTALARIAPWVGNLFGRLALCPQGPEILENRARLAEEAKEERRPNTQAERVASAKATKCRATSAGANGFAMEASEWHMSCARREAAFSEPWWSTAACGEGGEAEPAELKWRGLPFAGGFNLTAKKEGTSLAGRAGDRCSGWRRR